MNKILYIFFITILLTSVNAKSFSKEASIEANYIQKGEEKYWCPVCGMSIKDYYKTSHSSKLENGTSRQYCSISCLTRDKEEYGILNDSIKVIDAKSEKYIDSKKAFYVIGSKVKGTMSMISKIAFEKEKDANEFIKNFGGEISNFDKALKITEQNLKKDLKKIKTKKIKKVYPKGKKIFEKLCIQEIEANDYLEINELKADIQNNKLCKNLDEKKLHAVALYLWEVKRVGILDNIKNKVQVEEKEKCPVCGMFVAKYPRWAAQIFYKHEDHEHKFSFDGVKDLMKFYFNSKKWGDYPIEKDMINKILVTDYYSQEAIDGTKAYYVIGSDVYGPMGHELIPFEKEEDAKIFKKDHNGKKIIQFKNIKEKEVYKLDE